MERIEQRVIEGLKALSMLEQQEVLDFVEFLQSKSLRSRGQRRIETQPSEDERGVSFLEAAERYIGCVEGPGDLSTNPTYMDGYGT